MKDPAELRIRQSGATDLLRQKSGKCVSGSRFDGVRPVRDSWLIKTIPNADTFGAAPGASSNQNNANGGNA